MTCFEKAIIKERVNLGWCNDDEVLFKWVIARKIRFENVSVNLGCAEEGAESCVGAVVAQSGPHLRLLSVFDSSGEGLRYACDVARSCTNIVGLTLGTGVSDIVATAILSSCSQLLELKIDVHPSEEQKLTNQTLNVIGKFCRSLKKFDIFCRGVINDAGLLAVAKGTGNLEVLKCNADPSLTEAGVARAVACWSLLKHLEVVKLGRIMTCTLAASCPKLETLDAACCDNLTDADLTALLTACKLLTSICLCDCSQLTCAAICKLKNLDVLTLCGNNNIDTSTARELVMNSPALRNLALLRCSLLESDIVMYALENGKQLVSLALCNVPEGENLAPCLALADVLRKVVTKAYPRMRDFYALFISQ
jgi:hypothetical protein